MRSVSAIAQTAAQPHYRAMSSEPQASRYRPDPAIRKLAGWLADPVEAASFPTHTLRFRNRHWAALTGLADLSDEDWIAHFGRFQALPDNLDQPLAMRYHGHQFRVYNPDIGDGRGFLFAQLRDGPKEKGGRLLDFGTKGSGQTPHSRDGDGRLTLKGAVREVLAAEMLEALGVYTSKTLSVVETGEELWRNDEPSPARSAVMVRLSHGHVRIGTFQRLLALEERNHMEALVDYCLAHFPGPPPPDDAPARDEPAVILMHHVVERLADLAASWMVAGFVHGVLNTDNMNISGESFDYGPWRFLPRWDPAFTAAYFDQNGLYAFGRQPEAVHWNCGQLAVALRLLADAPPLIAALERFGPLYMDAIARRWCWRMGLAPRSTGAGTTLVAASEKQMRESGMTPDDFFYRYRCARDARGELAEAMEGYDPLDRTHPYWDDGVPQTMLIEEVEALWSAIDEHDDWQPFEKKVAAIRRMREAHAPAPLPAGHART